MNIEKQLQDVLEASRKLNLVGDKEVKQVLYELANKARQNSDYILAENNNSLNPDIRVSKAESSQIKCASKKHVP